MDYVGTILVQLVMWCPPGYFVLQWLVIRRTEGSFKKAAWIVAGVMGAILAFVIIAGLAGSNIAPIIFIFATPPACAALGVIWFLQRRTARLRR